MISEEEFEKLVEIFKNHSKVVVIDLLTDKSKVALVALTISPLPNKDYPTYAYTKVISLSLLKKLIKEEKTSLDLLREMNKFKGKVKTRVLNSYLKRNIYK